MTQQGSPSVINTPRNALQRPMKAGSTVTSAFSTTFYQAAKPETTDADNVVFEPNHNHVMIYPILSNAENEDGILRIRGWRPVSDVVRVNVSSITAASAAGLVTSSAHGLSVGDKIDFAGVVGMTEINGKTATVTAIVSATAATLDIDTSDFTAYSSGGTITNRVPVQYWVAQFIGDFDVTAGAKAGAASTPVLADEYFADTIVANGAYNTTAVPQVWSPADDSPGYILLDALGFPLVQVEFDCNSGPVPTASATMNILIADL